MHSHFILKKYINLFQLLVIFLEKSGRPCQIYILRHPQLLNLLIFLLQLIFNLHLLPMVYKLQILMSLMNLFLRPNLTITIQRRKYLSNNGIHILYNSTENISKYM